MNWLKKIAEKRPLIVCVTNCVTVNDVANVILAGGASPVVCEEPLELGDFIRHAGAVLVNFGTVSERSRPLFREAMRAAAEYGCPVVCDPVGVGAAAYRTKAMMELLDDFPPAVIRCNASEAAALAGMAGSTSGVDAMPRDEISDATLPRHLEVLRHVAERYRCIVSISGTVDVIGNRTDAYACRNGVPWMSRVTGTGCSLSGLTAAFAAVADAPSRLEAVAEATAMMGVAGDMAYGRSAQLGLGTFHAALLDALSMMTDDTLAARKKLEKLKAACG